MAKQFKGWVSRLMALIALIESAAAVWNSPQFNIMWAFLAVVSLLLAIYWRNDDTDQGSAL